MHHRYPKAARLRRKPEFLRLATKGRVCPGAEAVVRSLRNSVGHARLGIATPRRFGSAVQRNRFRRLVREAFRELGDQLGSFDYMVAPRRSLAEPTLRGLREDLLRAHRRTASDKRPDAAGA